MRNKSKALWVLSTKLLIILSRDIFHFQIVRALLCRWILMECWWPLKMAATVPVPPPPPPIAATVEIVGSTNQTPQPNNKAESANSSSIATGVPLRPNDLRNFSKNWSLAGDAGVSVFYRLFSRMKVFFVGVIIIITVCISKSKKLLLVCFINDFI